MLAADNATVGYVITASSIIDRPGAVACISTGRDRAKAFATRIGGAWCILAQLTAVTIDTVALEMVANFITEAVVGTGSGLQGL